MISGWWAKLNIKCCLAVTNRSLSVSWGDNTGNRRAGLSWLGWQIALNDSLFTRAWLCDIHDDVEVQTCVHANLVGDLFRAWQNIKRYFRLRHDDYVKGERFWVNDMLSVNTMFIQVQSINTRVRLRGCVCCFHSSNVTELAFHLFWHFAITDLTESTGSIDCIK